MERNRVDRNLLVIDYDFFFPNPFEAGDSKRSDYWFFDWAHREVPMLIDDIWPTRALSFYVKGLELPQAKVPDNWWGLFDFTPGARLYYADSNVFALQVPSLSDLDSEFKSVWLYDAHHDSGYNIDSVDDFIEKFDGRYTCEDWMIYFQEVHESELHWRWPVWHKHYNEEGPKYPKGVHLDAAVHNLAEKPPVAFSDVFLCRSGAWVPPWAESGFHRLLKDAKHMKPKKIGPLSRRTHDFSSVKRDAELIGRLHEAVEMVNYRGVQAHD